MRTTAIGSPSMKPSASRSPRWAAANSQAIREAHLSPRTERRRRTRTAGG
ncbi:hypothetical protein [Lyngbya sp. CCY1209]|nr:hypothetical protein [Lyngbya sp. CCY1209]MEB3884038.1 hypothetical protein [Lyngbya sp. CCY1209]